MIEERLGQDNAYNHLEQLTEVEDTVSYTYDANGNRATMVSKVDDVVYATTTYSYNLANMVVSMTNDPSNESAQTFTYTYYLDGNQRTKTEGTKVTTYAYDYAGRLVSEVTTDNGTPSVGYTYTYDDFGNRLTMTTDGVTTNYTYDLNNRLLQTTAGETTVTYTYNANGDMITEYKVVENIPEQNTTYTYSIYTGLLTSVSSTVGNVNASYDYNASGLRMKNGDTYFIYDGQNIVAEYDLAEDEYIAVYGYGINRISRFTDGTTGEIYLFNAHGDVVGLVAISGENIGKVVKEYDYDAFGNEVFPDPDDNNPFRYCGEYYDKGTNRLYLRARDYDSATGRFTSEDPIGYGLNWYTYCENNPVGYIDSLGLAPTKEEAAAMADHIYNDYDMDEAGSDERTVAGWKLIYVFEGGPVSTMKLGVYIPAGDDPENPSEYALVFRGSTTDLTDPETYGVWANNIAAYTSSSSIDMWTAIHTARLFVMTHSQETTFIGHSKGGGEAIAAALATKKNAITFNAANFDMLAYGLLPNIFSVITNYYIEGEILSSVIQKPLFARNIKVETQFWKYYNIFGFKFRRPDGLKNHGMEAFDLAWNLGLGGRK